VAGKSDSGGKEGSLGHEKRRGPGRRRGGEVCLEGGPGEHFQPGKVVGGNPIAGKNKLPMSIEVRAGNRVRIGKASGRTGVCIPLKNQEEEKSRWLVVHAGQEN